MSKADEARALFKSGANCAQAVFGAFASECGLTQEAAFKIASGFGGGFSRMREVCGAVSGMVLAVNTRFGQSDISDKKAKDAHYAEIQKLMKQFQHETGSLICRELLGLNKKQQDAPTSQERTAEYYRKRPCVEMVALAAEITEAYFQEKLQ